MNSASSQRSINRLESQTTVSSHDQNLMSPLSNKQIRTSGPLDPVNIPQSILDVEYAVRGKVVVRSMEIEKDLSNKPYNKLLPCHIGNPHAVGMKPLTYLREVCSLVACPALLTRPDEDLLPLFAADSIRRARRYYAALGETGSYTHSQGAAGLRSELANFFGRRDGQNPDIKTIFMSNGASDGLNTLLTCLVGCENDAVMLPRPQYPLYAAAMTKLGGKTVYYDLDEEKNWGLSLAALTKAYEEAVSEGYDVKAICVISPGNPAPCLLDENDIQFVLKFAEARNLLVIADEVYQENLYEKNAKFTPFRKVLLNNKMTTVQLASVHSASKGFYGECGFRAGCVQFENLSDDALAVLYKMRSVELCPNTIGQCIMAAVTNPPKEGDESYHQFAKEKTEITNDLAAKAKLAVDFFNTLEGVTCKPVKAAMYCFPKLDFTETAIETAAQNGMSIELFYCTRLLEETGIVTTPGDGFGQVEGTHHVRYTILPELKDFKEALLTLRSFHTDFWNTFCI